MEAHAVDPARAYAQLHRTCLGWGARARLFEDVPSTQDEASRWAAVGAPSRSVVLAVRQSAGRGRSDRAWDSPGGGLWGSWVFRDPAPTGLPLMAALAVARVVESSSAVAVTLRWPNDVLVGGRKLSGVLVDTRSRGSQLDACVIGIGLNVNLTADDFSPSTRDLATSLQLLGGAELDLGQVLFELDEALSRTLSSGWPAALPEVRQRMLPAGTRVEVTLDGQTREARVESLADDGALRLEDGSSLYRVDRLSVI